MAQRLQASNYNAVSVYDIGCEGKSDEIIYKEAFKADRILLTHDDDFLNNKLFELKFSTPTIILPIKNFEDALVLVLWHIAPYYEIFKEMKIKILPEDYSFHATLQNYETGAIEVVKLRYRQGDLEKFYEDK